MSAAWGGDSHPPSIPTLHRGRLDDLERDVTREFLNELVGMFLSDVAVRLEQLADAVKTRDTERTKSLAHSLQGSAATLGVLKLRAAAQKLEELALGQDWTACDGALARLLAEFHEVRVLLLAFRGEAGAQAGL